MVYLKSVENVITLGKLIGLLFLFCLPLLSILFLKTKRNDLAHPVMGTIFLVIVHSTLTLCIHVRESFSTCCCIISCVHSTHFFYFVRQKGDIHHFWSVTRMCLVHT